MASAFKNIKEFKIISNYGGQIDLLGKGSFTGLQIYQSILDDTIRSNFELLDTGNRGSKDDVNVEEEDDIKITVGEQVNLILSDYNEFELDFTGIRQFTIEDISSSSSSTMNEMFGIHLCQKEYVDNQKEKHYVTKHFESKIHEIVFDVLRNVLGTPKEIYLDPALNLLPINGMKDTCFDFCTMLGPKSKPENEPDSAGYLFFENYNGFHFRSIDELFKQEPRRKMIYNDTNIIPPGYTNKILNQQTYNNMNLVQKMKTNSLMNSRLKTIETYQHTYNENDVFDAKSLYKVTNNAALEFPIVAKSLGVMEEINEVIDHIPNVGSLPPGRNIAEQLPFSKIRSFNLEQIVRQAISRYNQLFLYRTSITIHGDFDIYPGDIIECTFPEVSAKDMKMISSEKKSGLYMVADICHYINAEHCYTKINMIKDSIMSK